MQRKAKSKEDLEVLTRSRRRCCLCFALDDNHQRRKGQIAHLDGNKANNKIDNLAYLCFDHHDEYDSTTSQSKSLQISEVKKYRADLYAHFATSAGTIKSSVLEEFDDERIEPNFVVTTAKTYHCSYCKFGFFLPAYLGENPGLMGVIVTCPKCKNVEKINDSPFRVF